MTVPEFKRETGRDLLFQKNSLKMKSISDSKIAFSADFIQNKSLKQYNLSQKTTLSRYKSESNIIIYFKFSIKSDNEVDESMSSNSSDQSVAIAHEPLNKFILKLPSLEYLGYHLIRSTFFKN